MALVDAPVSADPIQPSPAAVAETPLEDTRAIRDTAAAAADALDVDLDDSRRFGEEWVRAI